MKKLQEAHVPYNTGWAGELKKGQGDSDHRDDHGRFCVHETGQPQGALRPGAH